MQLFYLRREVSHKVLYMWNFWQTASLRYAVIHAKLINAREESDWPQSTKVNHLSIKIPKSSWWMEGNKITMVQLIHSAQLAKVASPKVSCLDSWRVLKKKLSWKLSILKFDVNLILRICRKALEILGWHSVVVRCSNHQSVETCLREETLNLNALLKLEPPQFQPYR